MLAFPSSAICSVILFNSGIMVLYFYYEFDNIKASSLKELFTFTLGIYLIDNKLFLVWQL